MTSNDFDKWKMVFEFQTKTQDPGNTVAATNPVMTSNDL